MNEFLAPELSHVPEYKIKSESLPESIVVFLLWSITGLVDGIKDANRKLVVAKQIIIIQ